MNKKFTVSHRGLPRVFLYQRCQTTLCLRSNFLSTLQKYEDFLNPQRTVKCPVEHPVEPRYTLSNFLSNRATFSLLKAAKNCLATFFRLSTS